MRTPDIMLNLPSVAKATPRAIRDALIETGKAMIAHGYEPDALAWAFISAGTTLNYDIGGQDQARAGLELATEAVRRAPPKAPLDISPKGRH